MRRAALPFAILLVLGASAPRAEDFTGFYAGLNASYAMNRDRDRDGHRVSRTTAAGVVPGAADGLPPSAASAAKLMQDRRTGADANAAR
ncbi:hypothetical protein [Methylobacterium trifolii]|uniref:Uncharacterized protein n=1 Tax=Methylobacterium trifolii TaxID=1003092 RepID=A0ABQ4TV10_9HYPH|nr:hypothetical protein [Methylobacterium trifolii]GJE58527.1 hypothetical protein MPOCJGCO_0609 [Methylobacterium trifolii]